MSAVGAGSIAEAPPEIKHSNTSFACISPTDASTLLDALIPSSSGRGWLEWNVTIRLSVLFRFEFLVDTRIPEITRFPRMFNAAVSIGTLAFPTAITLTLERNGTETSPI